MRRGQLPAGTNPRLAAIGLDALLFGLISNWLANHDYVALERQAEAMIDLYFQGLAAARRPPARGKRAAGRARRARR